MNFGQSLVDFFDVNHVYSDLTPTTSQAAQLNELVFMFEFYMATVIIFVISLVVVWAKSSYDSNKKTKNKDE